MLDMTDTIAPRSDQLNADDLISGPITVTITDVRRGSDEQPVNVVTAEFGTARPYKPSKSMRRVMVAAWGKDASAYTGQQLTLYRDPRIRFGKDEVGGIRISAMTGIDKPMSIALTVSKGKREAYQVQPLKLTAAAPTGPTLASLLSAFEVAGIEKDRWLAYCSETVGRELESARDLTPDELAAVLAAVESSVQ